MTNTKPNSFNEKEPSRFENMMDNYCLFIDCGVRGSISCFSVIVIGTLIAFAVPSIKIVFPCAVLISIAVLLWRWSHDHAIGYVPLWFHNPKRWLEKRGEVLLE